MVLESLPEEHYRALTPSQGWASVCTDRDRVRAHTYLFLAFLPTVLSVSLRHRPVDLRKKKNFSQAPFPLHMEARGEETVVQS